jgi:hypothetical protein
MNKQISRVWTFASGSTPDIEYETLQTQMEPHPVVARAGLGGSSGRSRSCKHTRYVDMGRADDHCKAKHSYETQTKPTSHAKHQIVELPKLGCRKFAL